MLPETSLQPWKAQGTLLWHPSWSTDTQVPGKGQLSQEDPLEKEMATLYCILAWEIPWTEETGKLQSMGLQINKVGDLLI